MAKQKAIQYKVPKQASQPAPFRLSRIDGGLNLSEEQSQIRDNQSPYLKNVMCSIKGALKKRWGQEWLLSASLGASAINGLFGYQKQGGSAQKLIHHGTKLYEKTGTAAQTEIFSGLANAKSACVVFGDKAYVFDGTNLIETDGTSGNSQAVAGYVPLYTLNKAPNGGGDSNEQLNYLSNSWKDSFSGTAGVVEYHLSFDGLNSDTVLAWVDGTPKTETVDFTVNRTTGVVTFTVAPGEGTNNVVIQGAKDGLMDSTFIKKNRHACLFGGSNDTRIFLTGNPDAPSTVYWCYVNDPTYWPEENYAAIGSDADANTGFVVQYADLVLFKERSIWRIEYEFDGTTETASFPSYPLNSAIGCDMPCSIQLIENMPVFCNSYAGVHCLVRTDARTERNVLPLSRNINTAVLPAGTRALYDTLDGLLDLGISDLQAATSVDFDGKYFLCIDDDVFFWDYKLSPYQGDDAYLSWFYWTGINANCWLVVDRDLYYGDRDIGNISHFIEDFADFDTGAIAANWRSKLLDFGLPEYEKTIQLLHFRSQESANTRLTVQYYDDRGQEYDPVTVTSASFSWTHFSWTLFTWSVHNFPPEFRLRPKMKKTRYFQFEVSNETLNQDFSFIDLVVRYAVTKLFKG